jgi:hypothetical protein
MDKCVFWNRVGPETVVDLANGEVAGIDSCSFSDNATSGQPCLMLLNSHLTATHCVFERNSSTSGAGALCLGSQSSADIISCAFRNTAANATSGGGGAASASNDCSARFVDCTFLQDSAGGGGALDWLDSTLELHRCLFAGATATYWGGAVRLHRATALIESCTFYACSCTDNPTGGVVAMSGGSDVTIGASIVAFSTSSGIYADLNSFPAVSYCDVFACQGGLYSGAIPDLTGHNGNISADPLFCGASQGDFTIDASSPCAGTAPDGGDIGAFGVGCGAVVVEPLSWGRIKAMFR